VRQRANPLSFDDSFTEKPKNIRINFTLSETSKSLNYVTSADSMDLSVFVFMQLFFSKANEIRPRRASTRDTTVL